MAARAATLSGGVAAGTPSPSAMLGPLLQHGPRLAVLAARSLLLPAPGPMKLLGWELSQPWTIADGALGLLLLGVVVLLGLSRRTGMAVRVLGALLTVLPAVLLADGFWLGLDRYLYQPACLLLLGWPRPAPEVAARTAPWRAWGVWAAGGLLLTVMVLGCRTTAAAYRSHTVFARAMIEARPEDPTGYVVAALDALHRGDAALAGRLIEHMPTDRLPAPHAHRAFRILLQLGRTGDAGRTLREALGRFPDDPRLLVDRVALLGAETRWQEAAQAAGELVRAHPERRPAIAAMIMGWVLQGHLPADVRERLAPLVGR